MTKDEEKGRVEVPQSVRESDFGCPNCLWAGVECHPETGKATMYREKISPVLGVISCANYSYCD